MAIRLPSDPRESSYEDLISACLTGLGFFVEANLHLRDDTTEILELDVVATPVVNPLKDVLLLDAKSGKTGIADIFKMFGWRVFLGIPRACIVRPTPPDPTKVRSLVKLGSETSVHVATVNLKDFDLSCIPSKSLVMPDALRDKVIANAWYGRIGKRLCIQDFTQFSKQPGLTSPVRAKEYRWAIEQSFFARQPLERARAVYDAYQSAAGITGVVIDELASKSSASSTSIWDQVRDTHERKAVQFCLMMEHTARLRIVKNSLIHLIQRESAGGTKDEAFRWLLDEWAMPASCQNGMARLQNHEFRNRIPFLWQLFIEVFGGYYCLTDTCDVQLLSDCTGIPVGQIPECLDLYGEFFPNSGGWFMTAKGELRIMKNVPAVYHGTGAFLRDSVFGSGEYAKRIPQMAWLVARWHNALYAILEPELKAS